MSVTDPGKRLQKILWPNKKEDRPNNFVLAGLGPAIHAFEEPKQGVDARIKSAQDELGRYECR
jgi:hypothetical protein